MATLKYKVIKSNAQYKEYANMLEGLVFADLKAKDSQDEIDLLTLLIEKWDAEHAMLKAVDPIKLLHSMMDDHKMKSKDIVQLLKVSKGYVSDILHYKKGLSKESIRVLSAHFKVNQEAFNRPYKLVSNATQVKKSKFVSKAVKRKLAAV